MSTLREGFELARLVAEDQGQMVFLVFNGGAYLVYEYDEFEEWIDDRSRICEGDERAHRSIIGRLIDASDLLEESLREVLRHLFRQRMDLPGGSAEDSPGPMTPDRS
jgi:hypothetical protein